MKLKLESLASKGTASNTDIIAAGQALLAKEKARADAKRQELKLKAKAQVAREQDYAKEKADKYKKEKKAFEQRKLERHQQRKKMYRGGGGGDPGNGNDDGDDSEDDNDPDKPKDTYYSDDEFRFRKPGDFDHFRDDLPSESPNNSSEDPATEYSEAEFEIDPSGKAPGTQATHIKFPPWPEASGWQNWYIAAVHAIAASCPQFEKAWRWAREVGKKNNTFEELGHSRGFSYLDGIICTELTSIVKSPLKEDVEFQYRRLFDQGKVLRGRQVFWMMKQHFRSDPQKYGLIDLRRLLNVRMNGNDLQGWMRRWDFVLNQITHRPPTKLLKSIMMLYLEKVPCLKEVWDRLERLPEDHPDKRYNSIINRIRTIIAQQHRKKIDDNVMGNAGSLQECALLKMISGKSGNGGGNHPAAPATGTKGRKGKGGNAKKGKGKGKGSGSPTKTSAADRLAGYKNKGSKPDQPFCWKYNRDACQHKAKDCKFNHCNEEKAFQKKQREQKPNKTAPAPPAPHSTGRPDRPLKTDAELKELKKQPCPRMKKDGTCSFGENCWFNHKGFTTPAAAAEQSKKAKAKNAAAAAPSKPNPKRKGKGKGKNRATPAVELGNEYGGEDAALLEIEQ